MDMLDIAILALRLALVLVLYLFLLAVLRFARRGLAQATVEENPVGYAPRPAAATRTGGPLRLVVLEPGASDLPPGGVIDVPDGATLGRAGQASIVVADPTVSAEHARVSRIGDDWLVTDLGSTNGTLVNQALVRGDAALAPGDVLGLGNVRLKVVGSR
jgi:hypothetical protein